MDRTDQFTGRTIAERVAEAAGRTFVGRSRERALVREAIAEQRLPFHVLFVNGPGGIGKSRFLQAVIGGLGSDVRAVLLDCRDIEPTPQGFQARLAGAIGFDDDSEVSIGAIVEALEADPRRTVLALDTYEVCALLDAWLRNTLFPALPSSVLTIIAGRERPMPQWRTAPGWSDLIEEIHLGALSHSEAMEVLRERGLSELQAVRANSFAKGYPLALELVAAVVNEDPDVNLVGIGDAELFDDLVDVFLSRLSAHTVATVEAASVSRRVDEPILRSLLDRDDVREEFDLLRRLPFVERTSEGLLIHDVVRETVERNLSVRDPEVHAMYRRRVATYFTERAGQTRPDLWQTTADLVYLIKNPMLREACFPAGRGDYSVEPATPDDDQAIRDIVARHEAPEAGALLIKWWERHPETFAVARDAGNHVAAFIQVAEVGSIDSSLVAEDPVCASWMEHLSSVPPRRDDRVLVMRRWLGRESGEAHSPGVAVCWLDLKRLYMALRPRLSRLYGSIVDLASLGPIFIPLGFAPAGDPVELDGAKHQPVWLDFGPGSVDGWIGRLIDAEVDAEFDAATSTRTSNDFGLTAREVEVLSLLADGCSNREIGTRLVISEKTANRHVSNIFSKLDVHSRAHAARIAVEHGLIQTNPA